MRKLENVQFTLTFRIDVAKRYADKELASWLKPLMNLIDDREIELHIVSEIGKNLKYHYHGYFVYYQDSTDGAKLSKMLFQWKHKHGFVALSYGSLPNWERYISKTVGEKFFLDHSEETINQWIEEILHLTKQEELVDMYDWLEYLKTDHPELKEIESEINIVPHNITSEPNSETEIV